jgi:hypothetical protein
MSRLSLSNAFDALKKDLTAEEGPRISTIRNYRFAILPYDPQDEFELRKKVRQLSDELRADGWNVLEISIHKLLMRRLRELDPKVLESWRATEKRQWEKNPEKALERLKNQISRVVEGEDGIAADIIGLIGKFADRHPDQTERTVIWIKRLGSIYPFSRSSNLLKVLDGKTRQLPVILLYPGTHPDKTALSFMGVQTPDRDYRPRIYS